MNGTWYSAHVGGGNIKSTRANKYLADDEDLNMLFASAVSKALKMNKKSKEKDTYDSHNDNESEHFNFEHIKIKVDSEYEL